MKICPVGAVLFSADGWMDRHDKAKVAFHNFAYKPKASRADID